MVIDGGGSFDPTFDPGQQVIAPFLWRKGIRRIDLMVLSHPHPDHANGLPFLRENFPVGEIWTNGQENGLPALARLTPRVEPHPISLEGVAIRPLTQLDPAFGENDNSLVVEIAYAKRKLLFTGDLERDGEARLEVGHADVVKVPHHGSRTSSTDELVGKTRPQLAVISVGERNRWGFPHPSVVARWQEAGARVTRTDRDGAVTLRVRKSGEMEVSTMLK
jgi:competence protein ComEC